MRNLKRALSLTLASVMLLGMMVVGSSAAGYPDVSEEENIEAIEVLQAVGVMGGDENGNFNPDDYVTREQMAVIMAQLLKLDYNYYKGTNPFSDVPEWAAPYVAACAANGVTAGIGGGLYGSKQNIQAVQAALMMLKALGYFQYAGDYGDSYILATVKQGTEVGLFDGIDSNADSALTRNEVAKMVLNALQADMVYFTGDPGITYTGSNGETWSSGYKAEYTPRTSTMSKYNAIEGRTSDVASDLNHKGQYYIQLGEELYDGDLRLRGGTDDFERPSRVWEYDGKTIGTYMKKEDIREEYTTGVNARTLYDLIGRTALEDYTLRYYVDGVEVTSEITNTSVLARSNNNFSSTGNGVLTQVFVDIDAELIDITSINTWLAKATSSYNSTRETLPLEIYTNYTGGVTPTTAKTSETVSAKDVPEIEGVQADEFVLVRRSGKSQSNGKYVTVDLRDAQILTDTKITEYSKKSSDKTANSDSDHQIFDKVVAEGTSYSSSKKAHYNADVLDQYNQNLLTNKTYDIYLDQYGYAIGLDLHSGTDNYVFITGVNVDTSAISTANAEANAIFLDGTSGTITVNVKDTNKNIENDTGDSADYFKEWNATNYDDEGRAIINRWFTYTVDSKDIYTLTPAARMFTSSVTTAQTIKCNSVFLDETVADTADTKSVHPAGPIASPRRAYGNDNSVFIVAELDGVSSTGEKYVITGVDGVYTGVQNVDIEVTTHTATQVINQGDSDETVLYDSIYTLYDKNRYVIGAVVIGEAKGGINNYAYILSNANGEREEDDGTYYWTFDAILNGKKETLTVRSKFADTIKSLRPGHVQELRFSGDYVTSVENVKTAKIVDNWTTDTKDYEVLDVGHVNHSPERKWECAAGAPTGYKDTTRLNVNDLMVDGNTLQTGTANERGLTLADNAPAVVINVKEEGKTEVLTEYDSVADALSTGLADADESTDKLDFKGRIVAVLDSLGRAKWVVFISDTEVKATPGGTVNNKPKPTGDEIDVYVTFKDGSTKVGSEVEIQLTPLDNGLLRLDPTTDLTGDAAVPAGYEVKSTDPITLTVISGTTAAVVEVQVQKAERDMKLPTDYTYTWATDPDGAFTSGSGTATSSTFKVPVGATVEVTVAGTGSDAFYIANPKAAADAADNVKYLTQGGKFQVTVASTDTATSLDFSQLNAAANKYYKVSAAANAGAGTKDDITFATEALAATYKKASETVSIAVTGTGTAQTGAQSVTIAFTGSTGTTPTTSSTITTPAQGEQYAGGTLVVGLGSPTDKDIAIVIVFS